MEKSPKEIPTNVFNNPYKLNWGDVDTPSLSILCECKADTSANQYLQSEAAAAFVNESASTRQWKDQYLLKPLFSGIVKGKLKEIYCSDKALLGESTQYFLNTVRYCKEFLILGKGKN